MRPSARSNRGGQFPIDDKFYEKMLKAKQKAIQKEEEEYNRRNLVELKKRFVEEKLEQKEHELFHHLKKDSTSVSQMFQEYV